MKAVSVMRLGDVWPSLGDLLGLFKINTNIKVPERLNIVNENTFDWNNYLSVLGMLRTIRESTDESYILPTQTKCNKLIDLVRKYLKENNELID
jgi:hypothetical protein